MAAFDLTDTNPFATEAFSFSTTDRPGFTFDSTLETPKFTDWNAEFEKRLPNLELNLNTSPIALSVPLASGATSGYTPGMTPMDNMGNLFLAMSGNKERGERNLAIGWGLKTAAAAGDLFTKLVSMGAAWGNANRQASNTKQSVANQMLALDNQIQYYKNQITDKFAQTMARNSVTMAAKNLRVTAGNLLEQTKDAAYDATKDIQMLESNARLKKIALRSEARQAEVAKKLSKNLMVSNLIGSLANVGLMVSGGIEAGVDYGKLFSSGTGSLNDTVYGG